MGEGSSIILVSFCAIIFAHTSLVSMVTGILFALVACFIWGSIFIVPEFTEGFSTMELALGRYLFYGAISLPFFLKNVFQGSCRYSLSIWLKILLYSLVFSYGYYLCVIIGVRCTGSALCALILGIAPITIALYGNWKEKEVGFRSLIVPSLLILAGLFAINAPHLKSGEVPSDYLLGCLASFGALAAWSWFVVASARFLRRNPSINSTDWTTMLGIGSLVWTVIFGGIYCATGAPTDFAKFMTPGKQLMNFVIGCSILGFLCSWVGFFFWNRASLLLPVSLAGQISIFETIFGVLFAYTLKMSLPSSLESLGILLFLSAIVYGIRIFARRSSLAH